MNQTRLAHTSILEKVVKINNYFKTTSVNIWNKETNLLWSHQLSLINIFNCRSHLTPSRQSLISLMLPPGVWYARCIFPPNNYNLFLIVNNDTYWYLHDYKGFIVIISRKSKFMHTWLTRVSWTEPGNNCGRLMHRGIYLGSTWRQNEIR